MKGYLLEETYELIDSIDRKNTKAVKEELGDIFLILVVISQMFKERGEFNLGEVLNHINNKLISRHPHVFSSKKLKTKEEVLSHWIKSKAKKKKRKSIKDRLPSTGPSLLLANIFHKEQAHLGEEKFNENEVWKVLSQMNGKLKSIKNIKNKKKLLTDAAFALSKIAFTFGIDLEGALRKAVLSQAKKTSYQHCKTGKK
jgi:uncharacterized protein YabN with tetrapyrrole methylase and pyrophosphatase domain